MTDSTDAAVLIADPEEAVCFALAGESRRRGLVPLVAGDGRRAMDIARDRGGSLVCAILDLRMLGADGFAVTQFFGTTNPRCHVVLMGTQHGSLAEAGQATGVLAVLKKPFDLSAFTSILLRCTGEVLPLGH